MAGSRGFWIGLASLALVWFFRQAPVGQDARIAYLVETVRTPLVQEGIAPERTLTDAEVASRNYAVSEHITVVDFYVDTCSGCRLLARHYKTFSRLRPDVAIRRIHMANDWNPAWAKNRYGREIRATPHVLILGPDGTVIAQDSGNRNEGFDLLYQWMNAELEKSR